MVTELGLKTTLEITEMEINELLFGLGREYVEKNVTPLCISLCEILAEKTGVEETFLNRDAVELKESRGRTHMIEFVSKLGLDVYVYKTDTIIERHRHRYEVNPEYIGQLEKAGLIFSGKSPDKRLMEIAELSKIEHPFMLGTQFHPEKSQHAGLQLLKNFVVEKNLICQQKECFLFIKDLLNLNLNYILFLRNFNFYSLIYTKK